MWEGIALKKRICVGVGVIVQRNGKLLLGKRKNAHGEGCWGLPGGHLEFGETFEECAARELAEETGLQAGLFTYRATTNDLLPNEEKHYVNIFLAAEDVRGEPMVCEPDKCESWEWFAVDKLPSPLFEPLDDLLRGLN